MPETKPRTNRFDHQPIRDVIFDDGRTLIGFARSLATDTSHARSAFDGHVPPSPQLRAEVAARLGLPIEALFTADALAAEYKPEHRPRRVRP